MLESKNKKQIQQLKQHLNVLIEGFDYLEHRENDPVSLLWTYEDAQDQALMGLLASGLAYGRVALVRRAGLDVAQRLGPTPTQTLMNAHVDDLREMFDGFIYRMTRDEDIVDLLMGCKFAINTYGSMEGTYAHPESDHITNLIHFVEVIRKGRHRKDLHRGLRYLIPSPKDKGACKRLHLYMRWMGRGPDAIDLGCWSSVDQTQLGMPLDTHTARICRYIGLTKRKTVDHKMVQQITKSLKLLDAQDPMKYDFPICHLGISGGCIHKYSEAHCPQCPLEPLCVMASQDLPDVS